MKKAYFYDWRGVRYIIDDIESAQSFECGLCYVPKGYNGLPEIRDEKTQICVLEMPNLVA